MEPRYEHAKVEEKIYRQWEESGYFNPDKLPGKRSEPYTIVMPPPNANGDLHVGHAVFLTLEDILTRFARMHGKKALWLPGADHAGFETQVVFEKKLSREDRDRRMMSRDELWQEIWDFTQKNKKNMEAQIRKLGASCDWSREKFTLDPDIVRGTQETFVKMYEDGLVYRGLRVVNWCPKHKTALSDLEVKYAERTDPLYYIKYGPLTLATVRPETKFGDTAIAVNPHDKRYKQYIGKDIFGEGILGPVSFRVIADEAVDPAFGTGVVKVTPAHDATDFEIWTRHKDEIRGPMIVIDEDGRLTGATGPFHGLKVAEAREKVAEEMRRKGILEKVDPSYVHQVATCYKCGTTLEPLPKPQWFVKMEPLAKRAAEAVEKKKLAILPAHSAKVYRHWLANIRDWNISRQIVWGIRIPAWLCMSCGEPVLQLPITTRLFLVRHGESEFNKIHRHQGQMDGNPLSEEGIRQAEEAGRQLKGKDIGLIVSSDLERCRMTAEIIAKATGAKLVLDERLREKNDGAAEGLMREELMEKYGDAFWQYDGRIPGGETWKELEARIAGAFADHRTRHAHKNVVIVTHGAPVGFILGKIKNMSGMDLVMYPIPKNAEIIELNLSGPCKKCGNDIYEQDPDVFDTWFSSGQWPYLALDYPKGPDYKAFYPTDVMETGYDILFFWVTRMVMLGLYRTGKLPFHTVYLHGLVRDKDRVKMSKSKGNVVNPLGVAETYGADALRMALVAGNTPGSDIVISEDRIRGYRNFATKIWNIARFIDMGRPEGMARGAAAVPALAKKLAARTEAEELAAVRTHVTAHLEEYEFHLAAEKLYHYIWHTLADKIVEAEKKSLRDGSTEEKAESYALLETLLLGSLKMLHPFMPFVTEELWQIFRPGEMLMVAEW